MRDRDFLLGATVDHVPTPFAANAVDRDELLKQIRTPLLKALPRKSGRLWWQWAVLDERETPPKELRTGRSLSKSRAEDRAEKAYGTELEKYHAERERGATS